MHVQLIPLLVFLATLAALMGITVLLHRYFHFPAEQSRKFLHVAGGILSIFLPLFFHSHWWVLVLTGIAFSILLFTYLKKLLPAVHQTKRYSLGSVLFPVPVYACFLLAELKQDNLLFWLPVSLLTFSDTAAEMGGQVWGAKTKQFFGGQKTMAGTLSFGVTALAVSIGWLYAGFHLPVNDMIILTVLLTLFCATAELVTLHGWDNLTVPAVAVLLLLAFR
jgi:phytol kinase